MLPFGKDVVYDFAHKFGVPYFKDTTPSWSTRGKLRRQLVRRGDNACSYCFIFY